jgi:hypothetical protein
LSANNGRVNAAPSRPRMIFSALRAAHSPGGGVPMR